MTRKIEQSVKNLRNASLAIKEHQESGFKLERLKALLEVAGTAAHEPGQLLTVLLGNIELMEHYMDNPEKMATGMAKVKEAGKRICTIVKKIQNIRNAETRPYLENISINHVQKP